MAINVANEVERERLEEFLDHLCDDLRDILMLYDTTPGTYDYIDDTMNRIRNTRDVITVVEGSPDRCEAIRGFQEIGLSTDEVARLFGIQKTSVKLIQKQESTRESGF